MDRARPFRASSARVGDRLRGAKPGDLPIEHPTRFSLVINLRAARSLGCLSPTKWSS